MRVLNFGSLNIDNVYAVDHFIRPGETMSSLGMEVFCGGKGLNQSIAMARAGAQVVVFKPNSFRDDTNSIADEINQGHTVVVNFEETNAGEARYILAFLSGASYANHGEVRPIAAKTYIFTPAGVSLSGAEIRDDLAQNGVTF